MRLLVMFCLLLSGLTMALPSSSALAQTDCHAMAAEQSHHGSIAPQGADRPPALHTCPGCAFLAAPAFAPADTPRPLAAYGAALLPQHPLIAAAPIPPPPRA